MYIYLNIYMHYTVSAIHIYSCNTPKTPHMYYRHGTTGHVVWMKYLCLFSSIPVELSVVGVVSLYVWMIYRQVFIGRNTIETPY